MYERNDLKDSKIEELKKEIINNVDTTNLKNIEPDNIIEELIRDGAVSISAPQEEVIMHMMTINSLNNFNGGESIKPGNITVNIKKLMASLPDLVLVAGSGFAFDMWIFKIAAFLVIWKTTWKLATVKLSNEHALVVFSLWVICNQEHKVDLEKGYEATVRNCNQLKIDIIDWERYIGILNDLNRNGHLVIEDNYIWMREWVNINYQ